MQCSCHFRKTSCWSVGTPLRDAFSLRHIRVCCVEDPFVSRYKICNFTQNQMQSKKVSFEKSWCTVCTEYYDISIRILGLNFNSSLCERSRNCGQKYFGTTAESELPYLFLHVTDYELNYEMCRSPKMDRCGQSNSYRSWKLLGEFRLPILCFAKTYGHYFKPLDTDNHLSIEYVIDRSLISLLLGLWLVIW